MPSARKRQRRRSSELRMERQRRVESKIAESGNGKISTFPLVVG